VLAAACLVTHDSGSSTPSERWRAFLCLFHDFLSGASGVAASLDKHHRCGALRGPRQFYGIQGTRFYGARLLATWGLFRVRERRHCAGAFGAFLVPVLVCSPLSAGAGATGARARVWFRASGFGWVRFVCSVVGLRALHVRCSWASLLPLLAQTACATISSYCARSEMTVTFLHSPQFGGAGG